MSSTITQVKMKNTALLNTCGIRIKSDVKAIDMNRANHKFLFRPSMFQVIMLRVMGLREEVVRDASTLNAELSDGWSLNDVKYQLVPHQE